MELVKQGIVNAILAAYPTFWAQKSLSGERLLASEYWFQNVLQENFYYCAIAFESTADMLQLLLTNNHQLVI